MLTGSDVVIRKYSGKDREGLRKISCDTAFDGSLRNIIRDDEILADALTLYFTDYEPGSCFIATEGNKAIGYLIGSKNVRMMSRIFNSRILPGLLIKGIKRGFFLRRENRRFLLNWAASLTKGEFFTPDFSGDYPAALHINLDSAFRRQGIGTLLIERYLELLKETGICGVHFATVSNSGINFFSKLGFDKLFESKRSYLRYCTGEDLPLFIFGKRLKS